METTMKRFGFVVVLGLLLVPQAFTQPNKDRPSESLKGISGVHVVIRYRGPVDTTRGLTTEQLKSDVELRLIADNVRVLSDQEWQNTAGEPYLYVDVIGLQLQGNNEKWPDYAFAFSVNLIQTVSTLQRPPTRVEGCTWTESDLAVVSRDRLRVVAIRVSDLVRDFATALKHSKQ
jgi:hypothetical protein